MSDRITCDEKSGRVEVVKKDGRTYYFLPLNNKDIYRGMYTLGAYPQFSLSRDTMARVLKFFYPDESLKYLKRYGYIDNKGVLVNFRDRRLFMDDRITYDEDRHRVIVKKANGIEYIFIPLNDSDEFRGMKTVYPSYKFQLSRRSMCAALKYFYRKDTLKYLDTYGYIDNAGTIHNLRPEWRRD